MPLDQNDRDLFRRIWSLAWPTVLYSVLEMTVGFVDLLMVRGFGPSATAAIGVGRQVTFLVEASALAISTGVVTLISQRLGAGQSSQANAVVRQSVCLVLLLGLPTTLIGYFLSQPLLGWLQTDPETLAHGEPYLRVYFSGIVFLWGNFVAAAIFRGTGDATTPLKLAVIVNLLNVLLNYVFIFGVGPVPGFQVQGAAMGTIAARGCGTLLYLMLLVKGTGRVRLRWSTDSGRVSGIIDRDLISRMLKIGTPMALAAFLRNSSRLVFLAIVGTIVVPGSFHAAVGIGLQLRLLSILPALAFQVATATLVGQAIGRNDFREAEALGRRSVQLLAVLTLVVVGMIFLFAEPLAALFVADSPETARLATRVLRWFAAAQFFSALSIATQGVLIGAGDTAPTMRYTLLCQWCLMVPLAFTLATLFPATPDGPLAAWTLAPAISLYLMQRRFHSGQWKKLRH